MPPETGGGRALAARYAVPSSTGTPDIRSAPAHVWSTALVTLVSTTTGTSVAAAASSTARGYESSPSYSSTRSIRERYRGDARVVGHRRQATREQARVFVPGAPDVERVGRDSGRGRAARRGPDRVGRGQLGERHAQRASARVGDQRTLRPGVVDGRDAGRCAGAGSRAARGEQLEGVGELVEVVDPEDAVCFETDASQAASSPASAPECAVDEPGGAAPTHREQRPPGRPAGPRGRGRPQAAGVAQRLEQQSDGTRSPGRPARSSR